jgi:hypothetical protein
MNEDILSFIWRFQYFNAEQLSTDEGQALTVLRTGTHNTHAGPDFSNTRVTLDGVEWIGCVEIHVKASDWMLHRHQDNEAYESVILHVVWENDMKIVRSDGTVLPTLSLNGITRRSVIERYHLLCDTDENIPCSSHFSEVNELLKLSMLDRVLIERLDAKAARVIELLQINQQNWEETAYQWLSQHFGFKLNDSSFLRLSQIIPWKILQKHRTALSQIEAILFGTAGLLPQSSVAPDDEYVAELKREFQFLSNKYGLGGRNMEMHEWKFLRLRPSGFPTIRMAQLAKFASSNSSVFNILIHAESLKELQSLFALSQSEYWSRHFQFGKPSGSTVPTMGRSAADLLIVNAVVPLMVAYARQRSLPTFLDKGLAFLSEIPAENNHIIRTWGKMNMHVKNAADSQALIEWHNVYCTGRRCLECNVGAALVRA